MRWDLVEKKTGETRLRMGRSCLVALRMASAEGGAKEAT